MNIEKITAAEIIDTCNEAVSNFYKSMMIGCGGQCYSRLYLDLIDMTLFESVEPSCNSWLHRDDGSLIEVAHDSGWGADLTDDELAWLEQDGLSEFGFTDWVNDQLEPLIDAALQNWFDKQNNQE